MPSFIIGMFASIEFVIYDLLRYITKFCGSWSHQTLLDLTTLSGYEDVIYIFYCVTTLIE